MLFFCLFVLSYQRDISFIIVAVLNKLNKTPKNEDTCY